MRVVLSDGIAEVEIAPRLGGGVVSYDLLRPDGREPLFRPAPAETEAPFDLGCNLLIPWSNRISGGGFAFDGRFHALAPNWPGEPFPIHGNAFFASWTVSEAGATAALLTLDSDGPGPFGYRAEARYALRAGSLEIALGVTNRAPLRLPYGLGLHPWLPRTSLTTLQAPAEFVWLEDARHLPLGRVPLDSRPEWDFCRERALPAGWINNGFAGWDGRARVHWPERKLGLAIEASPAFSTYMVYSPGSQADVFCFEPVSHPVDAFHLPGGPGANGLAILNPGETLSAHCRFTPLRLG